MLLPRRPCCILQCYAFSADGAKIVHLVRHGQGLHNVEAALRGSDAYKNECVALFRVIPGFCLADTTPTVVPARALKDARLDPTGKAQSVALGVRIREARMQVDVVLVSPLTRAVETALLMFPSDPAPTVPIVAVELCREAHGGHPCDQRRTISEISKEFPQVNFSQITTDHDAWHRKDRRCARKRGRGPGGASHAPATPPTAERLSARWQCAVMSFWMS